MGLINKLFGNSATTKEEKHIPWMALNDLEQLKAIESKSKTKAQVIFKHSTRCGISSMVMRQFVSNYDLSENDIDLYYLDLLSYRSISDAIAETFQVLHESPQLLVIKNGIVVRYASHSDVNAVNLNQLV